MAGGERLSDASTADRRRALPDFLGRPGPTPFHRLNPLTKATLATVTAVGAVVLGGLAGPALLVAVAVVLPAIVAGVLPRLLKLAVLLALPIALSAFIVNLFFFPGGTDVLLRVGPFTATWRGGHRLARSQSPRAALS